MRAYPPGETEQVERQPAGCGTVSPALTGAGARPPAAAIHAAVVTSWQGTSRDGDPQDQWAWACPGMGAQMGARSARTCSRPLASARPGTALTWAGTHSCRPPRSGNIPGGQGVAGSNPAVPTGSDIFSNIFTPHKSQQKSQRLVKWPSHRRAPIMCPCVLPGHLSNRKSQGSRPVTGQRSLSHLGSARRARQLRTGEHGLANAGCGAAEDRA